MVVDAPGKSPGAVSGDPATRRDLRGRKRWCGVGERELLQ